MATDRHEDAVEQIAQIREAFERAENAGDPTVIDDHCTDDVVALPPGQPPAVGKPAAKQSLEELFGAFDLDVEYTSVELHVGEELAFDRMVAEETLTPKDGGAKTEHEADSLWVYRRTEAGDWKQILATWNYRE